MIIGSVGVEVGVAVVAVVIVSLGVAFLKSSLKVVQQGCVGVVKRFGEFKKIQQPGLHVLLPMADRMDKVDVREFPRTGDKQAVIDGLLNCAESLLRHGKQDEAKAIYQSLASEGQPRLVRLAATRGLLACADQRA